MNNSITQLWNCIFAALFLFSAISGQGNAELYTINDFKSIIKIDTHVHILPAENTLFARLAKEENFKLLIINTDAPSEGPIAEQYETAVQQKSANPNTVAFVSTFSLEGWNNDNWAERTISYLNEAFENGAVGVKVWKNIGMEARDKDSNLIMIDNPKFDPIFRFIEDKGKVLIGHLGEPKNCWLPVEEMTINGDKGYFADYPQYHMFLHPELPSYEEQIAARDRMLDKHPNLKFVAAHLASLEWSVDRIADFLERFPNASVDMAARIPHFQYQTIKSRKKVREFFIKYQNRLLYATDLSHMNDTDTTEFKTTIKKTWLNDWKYFNTDNILTGSDFEGEYKGLALPKTVINKIYRENAEKIFKGAWQK